MSPREVSNKLHRQVEKDSAGHSLPLTEKGFTHMAMQWGQFIDHDITLTPQGELDCCNPEFLAIDEQLDPKLRRCLNIPVPAQGEPAGSAFCLPFTRSECNISSSNEY